MQLKNVGGFNNMTSKFIPRSQREQQQRRQSFDNECSKLQDINKVNKDIWEQKKAEEEARLNRHRRP
ncbi:Uncharacterised protein [Klebsiella pneumoniae]|nr:Uncharacterised protein [Klebsiella pneumoniae]VAT56536.1 Uncharacterised protein [Klebsiella pneumoniae]